MALELYLVRHGETIGNTRELISGATADPLTAYGEALAHARGNSLRKEGINRILSSPILRTRQTARIIHSYLSDASLALNGGWTEMVFGELEGVVSFNGYKRLKTTHLRNDPSLTDISWKPEGGESLQELYERIGTVLDLLVEGYDHQKVLVVSHGGPISMALLQMKNIPLSNESYHHFLPRANCVLTRATYAVGAWQVSIVNEPVSFPKEQALGVVGRFIQGSLFAPEKPLIIPGCEDCDA